MTQKNIDGFIIGIKNYNVFFNYEIDVKELDNIINITNKEIYISLNKIIYNSDITNLKEILIQLNNKKINGVIFEDIALINIVKELNLNINLIYNQIHFATNYKSINYWYNKDIKNSILSTELTLEEYINIKNNTKSNIFIYLYGMIPIFYSSRQLLTNYFNYINKNKEDNKYYINLNNSNTKYLVTEKNNETFIYNESINGIDELKQLKDNNIDYIILNSLNHTQKEFNIIIDAFIKSNNNQDYTKEYKYMKYKDKGFLYKKSIYKVKQ